MILLGLGGIILGSNLVVDNVAEIAASIGISQKIISVTIISIGTSLPELVTTVIAAKKAKTTWQSEILSAVTSSISALCWDFLL